MPLTGTSTPTPSSVRRVEWSVLVSGAVLAVGSMAVYWRSFSVPLLFDDETVIAGNPSIRQLWPIGPVLSPPKEFLTGGRPLLNFSYALNYAFGGTSVLGYHLVNLLIHVLAAWTLFGLVRRTLLRPTLAERFGSAAAPLALAVSAIWAWHPVQTESVTYLAQRAESLMGLFYLATLYCFIRGAAAADRPIGQVWGWLSVLACLAGVATKEVIVTAPVIVFLYDRSFISGSFGDAWRRHRGWYVALAATWLPLGRLMIGLNSRAVGFGQGVSWWVYGLTECRAVVKYVGLAVWPHPLVFDYGRNMATGLAEVWPYALVLAGLLAVSVLVWRRSPAAGFGLGWFFLILAPTSSIVPLVGQPMAENRLYLPLAGAVAVGVLGAFALAGRRSLGFCAVLAVGLGAASAQRNRDYRSEVAIWSDTVAKNPANPRAHSNLGHAWLMIPGRLDEAIAEFREALRLKPDLAEAHYNLGNALYALPDRLNEAVYEYQAAVRLAPEIADAHNNLGNALSKIPGRLNEAIAEYEAALRLQPENAQTHSNLGAAWLRTPGGLNDAIAQDEEALRLEPDDADGHNNLGAAWMRAPGRLNDAIAQYEAALRLRPDLAEAHFNLAIALLKIPGRAAEARAHFETFLRYQPGNEAARQILMRMH